MPSKVLGADAPKWQRLEAVCQEYLGAFPSEPTADEALHPAVLCGPVADWLESAKEGLELEMNRWDFLEPVPAVRAPVDDAEEGVTDLRRLDDLPCTPTTSRIDRPGARMTCRTSPPSAPPTTCTRFTSAASA